MNNKDSGTINRNLQVLPEEMKYDYIIRASGSSIENLQISWIGLTSSAYSYFKNFLSILLEIIKSQNKQLEFDGYYISYLLGNITEEEFESIAKKFAPEKKKIPLEHLRDKISILKGLRGHDITPKEMAQYLQCEESDIVKVLKLLSG